MHSKRLPRLALAAALAALACARPGTRGAAATAAPAPPSTPAEVTLVVAATTDVHGWLRGWDYYADAPDTTRGLTRAATIVDSLRAAHPGRVILLDAGDLLQGNPLAYVGARISADSTSPIVAAMNAMGYDAAAIGNHEFNYGVSHLERAVAQARFALLSANTVRPDGRHYFRPWTVVERAGIKVGIVGATTPGVMVWDRDNVRGRLEVRDIVPAVRQAVAEVRRAGAEVVLVTTHSGLDEPPSYDTASTGLPPENVAARLAREIEGIDLVVYGHSHKESAGQVIGRTHMLQPKNWAASVGVAQLRVTAGADGRRAVDPARSSTTIVRSVGHAESPALLAATERPHRETVAYVTTPIGSTPVAWRADSARVGDTPIVDLILEVERRAAGAELASSAAFSIDAALGPGPITVAQLARLYPYDNTLRAIRVSGRQLREYLDYSSRYFRTYRPGMPDSALVDPSVPGYNFDIVAGAEYTLDLSRPLGSRVTRLAVKGRPVADTDTFTLALNNYRQTGGGGFAMLAGAPLVYDRQLEIRQLLIEELQRRGAIRPEDYFARNWSLEPAAAREAAYRAMHGGPARRGGRVVDARIPVQKDAGAGGRFVRVLAINDFHGALEPRPDSRGAPRGGAAHLAALVRQLERECAPQCVPVLLAGGDLFQGTPASNLAHGRTVVDVLEAIGLAASAVGNHEFDWGQDTLRARMRDADFRILGANVQDARGRNAAWIPDDTIIARGGVRIGVVGIATPETATDTKAEHVRDLRFADPAPVIRERAQALRARGADVVVVVAHEGGFCNRDRGCTGAIFDVARQLSGVVDAIVAGHTHSYIRTRVAGVPIVQAGSRGQSVGVIDIPLGGEGGETSVVTHDVFTDSLTPDPRVDSLVRRAVAHVAPIVSRPVAAVAERLDKDEPPLWNLIADAQRWAAKADVAVMNEGGVRMDLRAGPATFGDLYEIQPFGNAVTVMRVHGADLRQYLERLLAGEVPPKYGLSGAVVRYDPAAPPGSRIREVRLADGRPLDGGATYVVAMNDFMSGGRDGQALAERAVEVAAPGLVDVDVLAAYLAQLPAPVRGPGEPRFVAAGR